MRVIAWVNKNSGPSFHRVILPLLMMEGVDVFVTNNLLEEHFDKGCDVLMYNRVLPTHADDKIKELQKKHGFRICVDIDDYWHLDPSHVLYEEYQSTNFAALQLRHIKEADVVLVTHSRLTEQVALINKNVHVCPNAIPRTGQFKIKTEPHEEVRVFWQGSDTHQNDIAILREPIDKLGSLFAKMKMVMAGYVKESDIWYDMVMSFTAGTRHLYKLIPPAPVSNYYKSYAEADICVVPLVESTFNRHKSNLKVLEAANMGLPVIASNVHPYIGLPIRYASTSEEWQKHIKDLVGSKRKRRDEGQALKEYCDKYFNFKKINEERKQILEHTIVKA